MSVLTTGCDDGNITAHYTSVFSLPAYLRVDGGIQPEATLHLTTALHGLAKHTGWTTLGFLWWYLIEQTIS